MAEVLSIPLAELGIAPGSADARLLSELMQRYDALSSHMMGLGIRRGLAKNARAGVFNGGVIPLGYRISAEGRYEIEEAEARIVRTVLRMYADGASYGAIEAACRKNGWRSRKGKLLTRSSVRELVLRAEKYHGTYLYGARRAASGTAQPATRLEGAIPALIDDATYEAIKARQAAQAERYGARKARS